MMDCNAAALETAPLDPRKLPNYVFGMVLGPTDFRQVLEHFEWKHRNANLLLHGSGTVCGLAVSQRLVPGGTDVEIAVSSGYAISPQGRWVYVPRDQCAKLNEWLQADKSDPYASPGPGRHRLYVTLCYDQCLTDLVPIAGQQCAPDDATRAPSRLLESFRLQFSWTPPPEPLEERVRAFGDLLSCVEIEDNVPDSLAVPDDTAAFLAAIRALAEDPLPLPGSVPGGLFRMALTRAADTISQALVIWITEVCPVIAPQPEKNPLVSPAPDDCLTLATIDFTIGPDGLLELAPGSLGGIGPDAVVIEQLHRPLLAPTRLLQEALIRNVSEPVKRTGTVRLAPVQPGTWPHLTAVSAPFPPEVPAEAIIEMAVEHATPELITGGAVHNVALTLHRAPFAAPIIIGTNLTGANLTEVIVRWRAYQR